MSQVLTGVAMRSPGMVPRAATPEAATMNPPAVELSGVGKSFAGRSGEAIEALSGVELSVNDGEFVCLIGASGCGKSTLLRIVAGFESPSVGDVLVGGDRVRGPGPDRGFVFQDYGLFPWLTVAGNIAYGPRQRGLPRDQVREITERFTNLVGLSRFSGHYPSQLSGGMQQRVAIARVLANDPAVMLMDEPFGALDSLTRQSMQDELQAIWRTLNKTILLVTHSVDEAVFLADRVVVMGGGPNTAESGQITKLVSIEIDRPRDVTSARFNEYKRELLQLIHGAASMAS